VDLPGNKLPEPWHNHEQYRLTKNLKRIGPVQFYGQNLTHLDNKMQADGIHCDLKAFYCINSELHLKVNFMELEVSLDSGSNYTYMTQSYIEIKSLDFKYSVYSDWDIIKHRVHLGSILGCLLFLIYH